MIHHIDKFEITERDQYIFDNWPTHKCPKSFQDFTTWYDKFINTQYLTEDLKSHYSKEIANVWIKLCFLYDSKSILAKAHQIHEE